MVQIFFLLQKNCNIHKSEKVFDWTLIFLWIAEKLSLADSLVVPCKKKFKTKQEYKTTIMAIIEFRTFWAKFQHHNYSLVATTFENSSSLATLHLAFSACFWKKPNFRCYQKSTICVFCRQWAYFGHDCSSHNEIQQFIDYD